MTDQWSRAEYRRWLDGMLQTLAEGRKSLAAAVRGLDGSEDD